MVVVYVKIIFILPSINNSIEIAALVSQVLSDLSTDINTLKIGDSISIKNNDEIIGILKLCDRDTSDDFG